MVGVLVSLFVSFNAFSARTIGSIQALEGDVQVERRGRQKPARFGLKIRQGSKIKTSENARVKIVFLDDNTMSIGPQSEVVLHKYNQNVEDKNQTLVEVLYGQVRSTLKQKYDENSNTFQIQTEVAVAGVRGTDFVSQFRNGVSEFQALEGQVEVGILGPNDQILNGKMVNAGQFLEVNNVYKMGNPSSLSQGQVQTIESWSEFDSSPTENTEGDSSLPDDSESTDEASLFNEDAVLEDIKTVDIRPNAGRQRQWLSPIQNNITPSRYQNTCTVCLRSIESAISEVVIEAEVED